MSWTKDKRAAIRCVPVKCSRVFYSSLFSQKQHGRLNEDLKGFSVWNRRRHRKNFKMGSDAPLFLSSNHEGISIACRMLSEVRLVKAGAAQPIPTFLRSNETNRDNIRSSRSQSNRIFFLFLSNVLEHWEQVGKCTFLSQQQNHKRWAPSPSKTIPTFYSSSLERIKSERI